MKVTIAKMAVLGLVGVMQSTVLTPQAHAGQDEWATAGKIMAGFIGAHAISDLRQPRTSYHSTTVVRHYDTAPAGTSIWYGGCVRNTRRYHPRGHVRRHHNTVVIVDNHCPRTSHHGCSHGSSHHGGGYHEYHEVTFIDGGVVRYVDSCTRIWQPRVRGHVAFIEERPFRGHPWIRGKKHPSIWR